MEKTEVINNEYMLLWGSLQLKRFIKDYSEKSVIIETCETVKAALEWLISK